MSDFVKYVEVHNVDDNYWLAVVYPKTTYERYKANALDEDQELRPIDVFCALDEVTVLSRTKRDYPEISIEKTDGLIQYLP